MSVIRLQVMVLFFSGEYALVVLCSQKQRLVNEVPGRGKHRFAGQ